MEPNFQSSSDNDSIIKICCSRKQSTCHVHAHTSHEIKKKNNESNKIVRFWQGFGKSIMAFLREFALFFFFGFFVQLFLPIGMLVYSVGWSMLSCNYGVDGQR